jgi:hypothetical protein
VDDYVNMGSGSGLTGVELQGNGGMSISFWLNTSTLANRVLLTKGTGSGSPLSISINSAGRLSFFRKYDGATHLNVRFNNQVVADNVWRHFVFTWNGDPDVGSVKLYKDGVLQIGGGDSGSGTKVADSTSWPLYAGYPALNAGFAGSLDDLRIYNRTLSPLEISELYAYNGNGDGAVTQQSSPVPGVCGSLVNIAPPVFDNSCLAPSVHFNYSLSSSYDSGNFPWAQVRGGQVSRKQTESWCDA